jgi:hypothetical protein
MMDELVIEELAVRATQEKMDDAFRGAMQRAINAGAENTPTVVSKKPGHSKSEGCLGRGRAQSFTMNEAPLSS